MTKNVSDIRGAKLFPEWLDHTAQAHLVELLQRAVKTAPLFSPETRWGKKMSVRMTSLGRYGWYSDRRGYRYERKHPTGGDWPDIPAGLLTIWHEVTGVARAPDCCLVNYYVEGAKMGLHQDRDEVNFDWPVVSISLGDDALFRIGGQRREDPTESFWLRSGDILVLKGESRLAFHGIDRIKHSSSTLLRNGGRINLTMRVVD